MKPIDRDDLESVPILLGEEGFPGDLSPTDAERARWLIRSSQAEVVLVAAGAGVFWWVDAVDQRVVRLVGGTPPTAGGGFAMGTGDGATVPGLPLDWDLLTLRCPQGDTTVLLARYPTEPPRCPRHDVLLELQDAAP